MDRWVDEWLGGEVGVDGWLFDGWSVHGQVGASEVSGWTGGWMGG